jgi:fatty-acyl-CoA synthase
MQVLGDVVRLNAKRYPRKKALIFEGAFLTYYDLNERVNRVAQGLLALGVAPQDRVAILASNRLDYIVIVYAILKCGGICVPINFRYKANELAYVVNNAQPKVLFYSDEFGSILAAARSQFGAPVQEIAISGEPPNGVITLQGLLERSAATEPLVAVDPLWPSFIMYTSGTTGFPKGVLFSHSSYINVAMGMAYEGDLRHDDVMMVNMPIFHNAGVNATTLPTLVMGGTCVITSGSFDPASILTTVHQYSVTVTMWVPTMLARLVSHPGVADYDCSSLKKIWYGSSAISPTVLDAAQKVFKAGFYQWYGQTETGMVSVLRPEDHLERSQYTGREIFNAEIRIVDDEGKDVSIGEVGEIITAQMPLGMQGYYGQEEATKRAIRDGWIHTEDLARVEEDGYFTVVDRLRDMIISGAENIYPKEIEDVISSHPGVEEVAAFGIPDEFWGEVVCVAVVRKKGYQLEQADIVDFCASRIASYKKPKVVEFRDDLPKNAVGKVTKNVLREPYWAGRAKRV